MSFDVVVENAADVDAAVRCALIAIQDGELPAEYLTDQRSPLVVRAIDKLNANGTIVPSIVPDRFKRALMTYLGWRV